MLSHNIKKKKKRPSQTDRSCSPASRPAETSSASGLPLPLEILERILCFCDRSTLVRGFRINRAIGQVAIAFTYRRVSWACRSDWLHPVSLTINPTPLRYMQHVRTLCVAAHPNTYDHEFGVRLSTVPNLRNLWLDVGPYAYHIFCPSQNGPKSCDVVDSLHYSTLILSGMVSPLDGVGPGFTMPKNGMLKTVVLSFRPQLCEKISNRSRIYTRLPASVTDVVFYYPLACRLLCTLLDGKPNVWEPKFGPPIQALYFNLETFARLFSAPIAHSPEKMFTFLDVNRWTPAFCGLPNSAPPHLVVKTVRSALEDSVRLRLETRGTPPEVIDQCCRNIRFISVYDYLDRERPDIPSRVFRTTHLWDIRSLELNFGRNILPNVWCKENGKDDLIHMPRDISAPKDIAYIENSEGAPPATP